MNKSHDQVFSKINFDSDFDKSNNFNDLKTISVKKCKIRAVADSDCNY